ncbi:MAG: peptide chain release factor N(5)-glutamine methyltransferase [Deltaproteobacteria bacterium]
MNHHTDAPIIMELYTLGKEKIAEAGIENPSLEAAIMLSRALGVSTAGIYALPHGRVRPEEGRVFEGFIERRQAREPIAYILGEREFYSRAFCVNRRVLIPRPETEILVEAALAEAKSIPSPRIADVGTGSGAVGVTIACERADAMVFATDISPEALEVARENAKRHSVAERISFVQADFLSPFADSCLDIVVSNPPYVRAEDYSHLPPDVRDFEPALALIGGGVDGLAAIRRVIEDSARTLASGGACIVEVGEGQSAGVREIFQSVGFTEIETKRDLSGIERVIRGKWRKL